MQSLLALLTGDQQAALVDAAEWVLAALGANPAAERRVCRLCDVEACGRARGRCPVAQGTGTGGLAPRKSEL